MEQNDARRTKLFRRIGLILEMIENTRKSARNGQK